MNNKVNLFLLFSALLLIFMMGMRYYKMENFKVIRKRSKGKIKLGTPTGSPSMITELLKELNVTGGQLNADAKYDSVDTDLLDKENIG